MSEWIDNQSKKRREELKKLIKKLHEGEDPAKVKKTFKQQFGEVSTEEISTLEQSLVEDGEMDVDEIQRLCNVHADVLGTNMNEIHKGDQTHPGHPLNVLNLENDRIEALIQEEIKPYLDTHTEQNILMLRIGMERLDQVRNHYARKEQLFFPYLEKKGITTPPKVMWGVHDEIRNLLKESLAMLNEEVTDFEALKMQIKTTTHEITEMVFKERNILIPLLDDKLNLVNFIEIAEESDETGYFLEAPEHSFLIGNENGVQDEKTKTEPEDEESVHFETGALDKRTLEAMINTLPLDITFVDAEGYVRYFSRPKDRIFERPKTVLGRHVNYCHPPGSVDIVEKIVNQLKSGEKDYEEFWIQKPSVFVVICFYAVRDKDNTYLGTLEVTQEISRLRKMEGEKRLMDDA